MIAARIAHLESLTPHIRAVDLAVDPAHLNFLPGQWVDVRVSGIDEVAGYSMTSTPARLRRESRIAVAVRDSSHPLSRWIHQSARAGDGLDLSPGGAMVYPDGGTEPLVLLAGGIGITPLWSMAQHAAETQPRRPVYLVYSAGKPDAFAFRREIEALAAHHPRFRCRLRLSGRADPGWEGERGRMRGDTVRSFVGPWAKAIYFLCGPSAMVADLSRDLTARGVAATNIRYERW